MCAGEEEGAADLQRDDLRCGRRRAGDILDPSLASCARRGIQVRAGRQSARMEAAARSRSGNAPFSNSLGGVIEFSTSTFSCALRRARARPEVRHGAASQSVVPGSIPRFLPLVVYLRRRPSPRQPLARRVLLCPHESTRQPTAPHRTRALRPPSPRPAQEPAELQDTTKGGRLCGGWRRTSFLLSSCGCS